MRTGIRNNDGSIVGEKWILTDTEVRCVLAALEFHGKSDTMGAPCAAALHERFTGEARRGELTDAS